MARFYSKISKNDFLQKIEKLMDNIDGEYPSVSKIIEKDLSKVTFDMEEYSEFDEKEVKGDYPIGYKELVSGFHVFFCWACGDGEYPVGFIYYYNDNKIRAYIPKNGNIWNKKDKCAYPYYIKLNEIEDKISFEDMKEEIIKHITLK